MQRFTVPTDWRNASVSGKVQFNSVYAQFDCIENVLVCFHFLLRRGWLSNLLLCFKKGKTSLHFLFEHSYRIVWLIYIYFEKYNHFAFLLRVELSEQNDHEEGCKLVTILSRSHPDCWGCVSISVQTSSTGQAMWTWKDGFHSHVCTDELEQETWLNLACLTCLICTKSVSGILENVVSALDERVYQWASDTLAGGSGFLQTEPALASF